MVVKTIVTAVLEAAVPTLFYRCDVWRHRYTEPELALLPTLCRKDAMSIDIGANIGLYTYYLPRYSGTVVAFEPLLQMQKRLTKFLKGYRASVYAVALSDRQGECEIRFPRGNPAWATIDPDNTLALAGRTEFESHRVPMRRLDDYQFHDVGFIKIDVEGHEELVLHGGSKTITRSRPNLLIEIEERHKQGAIDRVTTFLTSMGYRGYFWDADKMNPMEHFDLRRDQPIHNVGLSGKRGRYINNFIFLPA
jgi:FkbM family methyltransferase